MQNTGTLDLFVSQMDFAEGNAQEFSIESVGAPFVLVPGQIRFIKVGFRPVTERVRADIWGTCCTTTP